MLALVITTRSARPSPVRSPTVRENGSSLRRIVLATPNTPLPPLSIDLRGRRGPGDEGEIGAAVQIEIGARNRLHRTSGGHTIALDEGSITPAEEHRDVIPVVISDQEIDMSVEVHIGGDHLHRLRA